MNEANVNRLGYVGRKPAAARNSDSWFTPPVYLEAARKTLGSIILDPFSDARANEVVKADHYFDEAADGLSCSWQVARKVSVFMNPPYSARLVASCTAKFLKEHDAGSFQSGIILVNNATETRWFQSLLSSCAGVCFTHHRIGFWNADGKVVSNNTRGQAFFYFGADYRAFDKYFSPHGRCIRVNE